MTAPGREEPARKEPIHLLLLDDNRVFRAGLAAILRTHREMRVLDGPVRIPSRSAKRHPTVILFDVELEGGRSVEIVRKAHQEYPDARLLGMGMTPATAEILRLVREGVSGFILKDAPVQGFVEPLRGRSSRKSPPANRERRPILAARAWS
jgi:DNA-binding NarL/FixJ family response regulator